MSNAHSFAAGAATGLQLLAILKGLRVDQMVYPWILDRLGL